MQETWEWTSHPEDPMRPPPRTARLLAAIDRASRRVADAAAVLSMAEETRLLARAALERSRLLLTQLEQPKPAPRRDHTSE